MPKRISQGRGRQLRAGFLNIPNSHRIFQVCFSFKCCLFRSRVRTTPLVCLMIQLCLKKTWDEPRQMPTPEMQSTWGGNFIEDYPVTPWRDCSPPSGRVSRKEFQSIDGSPANSPQQVAGNALAIAVLVLIESAMNDRSRSRRALSECIGDRWKRKGNGVMRRIAKQTDFQRMSHSVSNGWPRLKKTISYWNNLDIILLDMVLKNIIYGSCLPDRNLIR